MAALRERLVQLFAERGATEYHGEPVSQLEHALQCAWLAEQANADSSLIVAAFLHDIGHLLHGHGEEAADHGIDDRHEALGDRFLRNHFSTAVSDPVRLHVPAKRYLMRVEPGYRLALSPASIASLALQGGPMSDDERNEFQREPHFEAACRLRRWDDEAKIPGLKTPDLDHVLRYVDTELAKGRDV